MQEKKKWIQKKLRRSVWPTQSTREGNFQTVNIRDAWQELKILSDQYKH